MSTIMALCDEGPLCVLLTIIAQQQAGKRLERVEP
jgi:hypothetical protein